MNDYQSVSTTDIPEAIKPAGTKDVETKVIAESKSDKSGEPAEIKAQDAVIEENDADTEADDTDVDAGESDQEKEESEEVKPKKKGGFQKKLEKKDREIEFLREQLTKQQPQEKPVDKMEQAKVDAADKPKIDDYDSQADYLEALTDWKVDQKAKEYNQKAQQETLKSQYQNRLTDFQKKGAEFSKSVTDYSDVLDDVSDVMLSPGMQEAIIDSEIGPEILYNLSKNRKELERINQLGLVAQAREIGKLEANLSKSDDSRPEVKTKTAAPPPPKPVGTKSPSKTAKDPSDMSFEEYKAWRAKK